MIVAYDGTAYAGWQTQKNGTAVQELLEKALFSITGESLCVQGSGRTDSGVHARAQVAHFDTDARMPADKFSFAMNTRLPRDIRILYSEEADADFHARFAAKQKEYRYQLAVAPHENVFFRNYALHVHNEPDYDLMCAAAEKIIGTHDFAAFKSTGTTVDSTVRTVFTSCWQKNGSMWTYIVSGNGFLYNMVRIFAGTMLAIGTHTLPPDAIERALHTRFRADAGPTAPAHGLTLWRVSYSDFDTEEHLPDGF